MIKLFIRLFSFVVCLGVLAGGAYLSYTSSDFESIKQDWDELVAAPWLPGLDLEGENTETEAPETEAPETEVPETEVPETEVPETETPEGEIPSQDASQE